MTMSFAVTWDYRCPFARNAHEHVVTALEAGAPWAVEFVPFSLSQVHVREGGIDAWDDPAQADTLVAMEAGIVVRDQLPDRFLSVHRELFVARHDAGGDLRRWDVIAGALTNAGVDADTVLAEIRSGWPRDVFRKAHTEAAKVHSVWGVPTFIAGANAAFVRLMDRPGNDADLARRTIEHVVETLTEWPTLNEFKHTSIPR